MPISTLLRASNALLSLRRIDWQVIVLPQQRIEPKLETDIVTLSDLTATWISV